MVIFSSFGSEGSVVAVRSSNDDESWFSLLHDVCSAGARSSDSEALIASGLLSEPSSSLTSLFGIAEVVLSIDPFPLLLSTGPPLTLFLSAATFVSLPPSPPNSPSPPLLIFFNPS